MKTIKTLHKCATANTSAIWQQAAHTTYNLPAAQQGRRMDHSQKNDETKRARGLGSKGGDRNGESKCSPESPDRDLVFSKCTDKCIP